MILGFFFNLGNFFWVIFDFGSFSILGHFFYYGKTFELEGCPNYLRPRQIILNSEVSKNDCSG